MVKKTEEVVPSHIQWRSETKWWQSVRKKVNCIYLLCARQSAFMCDVLWTLLLVSLYKKKNIFTFVISSYMVVLVFQNSSVRDRVRLYFWVLPLKTDWEHTHNLLVSWFSYHRSRVSQKNLKFFWDIDYPAERYVFLLGGFPREFNQLHGLIWTFTGLTSSNGFNSLGKVSLNHK